MNTNRGKSMSWAALYLEPLRAVVDWKKCRINGLKSGRGIDKVGPQCGQCEKIQVSHRTQACLEKQAAAQPSLIDVERPPTTQHQPHHLISASDDINIDNKAN